MSAYRDLVNNEIVLEGDDFGACAAALRVPPAPATAKKMQLVFRGHFDTFASSGTYTLRPWNHCNFLGLAFDLAAIKFPVPWSTPYRPDKFFGWINEEPFHQSTVPTYDSAGREYGNPGGEPSKRLGRPGHSFNADTRQKTSFLNGVGGAVASLTSFSGFSGVNFYAGLPVNPTDGALYTAAWEIYAGALDLSMYARLKLNFSGLEGAAMFDAFDAPAWGPASYTFLIHGDQTSHFRESFDLVHFPGYLRMRYSLPDLKMIFKTGGVKYFDWDDNELDPLPG